MTNTKLISADWFRLAVAGWIVILLLGCSKEPKTSVSANNQVPQHLAHPSDAAQLFSAARHIAVTAKTRSPNEKASFYLKALTAARTGVAPPQPWLVANRLWPELVDAARAPDTMTSSAMVETSLGNFLIADARDPSGQNHFVIAIDLARDSASILKVKGVNIDLQVGQDSQRLPAAAALAWYAASRIEHTQVQSDNIEASLEGKGLMAAGYLTSLENIISASKEKNNGSSNISSKKDEGSEIIQNCSSCEETPSPSSTSLTGTNRNLLITPIGLSPAEVRETFRVDQKNCHTYSFGSGFGCISVINRSQDSPIQMTDGYTPCLRGSTANYDFISGNALSSVGCHASEAEWKIFAMKMTDAHGSGKIESAKSGIVSGESTTWILGKLSVSTVKKLYGSEERYLVYVGEVGDQ